MSTLRGHSGVSCTRCSTGLARVPPTLAPLRLSHVRRRCAYAVEVAARVQGFTWLSICHHALYWIDAAYLLTLVQNPNELGRLGNTFCEAGVYASLTLHHASKLAPDIQKCSLRLTHVQLYVTVLHNLIFQASSNTHMCRRMAAQPFDLLPPQQHLAPHRPAPRPLLPHSRQPCWSTWR